MHGTSVLVGWGSCTCWLTGCLMTCCLCLLLPACLLNLSYVHAE